MSDAKVVCRCGLVITRLVNSTVWLHRLTGRQVCPEFPDQFAKPSQVIEGT